MFGEFVRAAAGFAGSMVIAALLFTVLDRLLQPITAELASDSLLVQTLTGAQSLAAVVAFLAVLVRLLGASVAQQGGR